MKIKIAHLTSAHPRYDTRIFLKECQSLANNDYDVSLVVADGNGDELNSKVNIYDVGKLSGRINRMLRTTKKVYQKALELDSDVYHLHDPELIPIGMKLLKKGKEVIFDAHEDLPSQILSKPYLSPVIAKIIAFILVHYERYSLKQFSGIIAATPFIRDKFLKINPNTIDINNYPILGELSEIDMPVDWSKKDKTICYVGGMTRVRGIVEICKAMEHVDELTLNLVGEFSEKQLEDEIQEIKQKIEHVDKEENKKQKKGDQSIVFKGFLCREDVRKTMEKAKIGLVTLYPIVNYLDALPVKMFEYMAVGLPVVASDIPLWKEIIETNSCGVCVNPFSPQEIAEAIEFLIKSPEKAKEMGENGKKAVREKYNWSIEEKKLTDFYEQL